MILTLALALALGSPQTAPADVGPTATMIANATSFEVRSEGGRIVSCTITATSGSPEVDRYVCDAARACGSQHRGDVKQAACMTKKREQLAEVIAKSLSRTK